MTDTSETSSDRGAIRERTAADVVAEALASAGVRHAFGVPGGEVLSLIEALGTVGIDFVVARHENAGGFMAEGTHRVTGAPALLVATLGPGVANTVNVAANALQDAVPLVILGGAVATTDVPAYSHQVIDQQALMRPIVKGSFALESDDPASLIHAALSLATEEPPGPVFIDCPTDVVDAPAPRDAGRVVRDRAPGGDGNGADSSSYPALEKAFEAAERPLILAGLHALRPGVSEALSTLARRHRVPVLTSYKAKGLLDERDDLALGGVGLSPRADAMVFPLFESADFILLLGYDPVEMRANWTHLLDDRNDVFHLSPVPLRKGVPYASHIVLGDPVSALERLGRLGLRHEHRWPGKEPTEVRQRLKTFFASRSDWEPALLFEAAEAILPAQAFVTVDTGAHRILLAQSWHCQMPGRFLHSTGFCTMACALPTAIGAKLALETSEAADGETPVVAFVGDGGFDMALGELCSLQDLGLPVVVVVIDDRSYALIDLKQQQRGLRRSGVDIGPTDYAAVAEAIGGRGRLVQDRAAFETALREAISASSFTIIHAPFAKGIYADRF